MIAPPVRSDEAHRLASLDATCLLFSPAEERFDRIARLVTRFFNVPYALVTLVDGKRQWFKAVQGFDGNETPREFSFCAHAIATGERMVVEDTLEDERFFDNPVVTGAPGIRAYAGEVIRSPDGAPLGTLCVLDVKPRHFSEIELDVLRDLAALVECEIERKRLNDVQQELLRELDVVHRESALDPLTRTWNQDATLEILQRTAARAEKGSVGFAIAVIDIDRFRPVNERFGQPAGDGVLREMAARIRRVLRPSDAVGRYGGEEFVVVFPDCEMGPARDIAERIRREVAAAPMQVGRLAVNMTVSLGLAHWDPGSSLVTLVENAEAAMLAAKEAGRNQVAVTDAAGLTAPE